MAHLETGYYDSRQDTGGSNASVENSQVRVLAGFERDLPEVAKSLTVGLQYYLEAMLGPRRLPPHSAGRSAQP